MRWRAWHADGSSTGSDETSWSTLPADVVLLKVWADDGRKIIYSGSDAIWWEGQDPDQVARVDLPEPFQTVAQAEAVAGRLKYGRLLSSEEWQTITEAALTAVE